MANICEWPRNRWQSKIIKMRSKRLLNHADSRNWVIVNHYKDIWILCKKFINLKELCNLLLIPISDSAWQLLPFCRSPLKTATLSSSRHPQLTHTTSSHQTSGQRSVSCWTRPTRDQRLLNWLKWLMVASSSPNTHTHTHTHAWVPFTGI